MVGAPIIRAADLFCGAGGLSTGMARAAQAAGAALRLVAVNHWDVAVETHRRNHPWATHYCADLAQIDPNKVAGDRLDLLVGSPECTHHSNARGSRPKSDQSRASAWHVVHWAERLRPLEVLVENVSEFSAWGPLLDRPLRWKGRTLRAGEADPRKRGQTFDAWINALASLGYVVAHRVVNAADYGDATTRRRLFVRASRGRLIRWPEPTHTDRHRSAREIIDWSVPGRSVFNRSRPLRAKTLDRIEEGLRRFGGDAFIVILRGTNMAQAGSWAKPLDNPLGTVTAGGIHAGICQPFLVKYYGNSTVQSVAAPLGTVTTRDRFALVRASGGDIRFRMLQPHELAAAMSFEDYDFAGKRRDIIKQIGNAVAVRTAQALCRPMVDSILEVERTV